MTTAAASSQREPAGGHHAEPPVPRLLTIEETADVLHVSVMTVRKYIDRGELTKLRLDRSVRIHPDDIAAFIASRRDGNGKPPRQRRSPSKR